MKIFRLRRKLYVTQIPPVGGKEMPEGMHVDVTVPGLSPSYEEQAALDSAIIPLFAMAPRFEMLANMIDEGNHSYEYVRGAAQQLVDELRKARS